MFRGAWMSVTLIHFEMEPAVLQPHVPFALDCREKKAYVSLAAFSQQKLRLAWGGALTAWAGALVANHDFLNLRAYVRCAGEPGIYFIAEWIPNRLALLIAPPLYGLPYRLGQFNGRRVTDPTGTMEYGVSPAGELSSCVPRSLDEFLLERYVAFTERRGVRRRFRVAHEPWPQTRVNAEVLDDSLLRANFSWWSGARFVGANVSPGVPVGIGAPERVNGLRSLTRRWA